MKIEIPTQIRQAWKDQPLVVVGVGAAAVTSVAKLIDSVSAAQGRRAYAKQVNHSIKKKSKK